MAFRLVKGGLSHCHLRPFALLFAAFCKGADYQLIARAACLAFFIGLIWLIGLIGL